MAFPFGVGIGDFIALGDIAAKVYQKCRDAGSEYAQLAQAVSDIRGPLNSLDNEVENSGSWFARVKQKKLSAMLLGANKECHDLLLEIEGTLKGYPALESAKGIAKGKGGSKLHQMLQAAKFGMMEVEKLKSLTIRVQAERENLRMVLELINLKSTDRTEQGVNGLETVLMIIQRQLEEIKLRMDEDTASLSRRSELDESRGRKIGANYQVPSPSSALIKRQGQLSILSSRSRPSSRPSSRPRRWSKSISWESDEPPCRDQIRRVVSMNDIRTPASESDEVSSCKRCVNKESPLARSQSAPALIDCSMSGSDKNFDIGWPQFGAGILQSVSEVLPYRLPERFSLVIAEVSEKLASSSNQYLARFGSRIAKLLPIITEHTPERGNMAPREYREATGGDSDESSLGSSSEDDRRLKKMRGKHILSVGFAAIALIHAAHSLYQAKERFRFQRRMWLKLPSGDLPDGCSVKEARAKLRENYERVIEGVTCNIRQANEEWTQAKEMTEELRDFMELRNKRRTRRRKRSQNA